MRHRIRQFSQRTFVRNVVAVASGTAVSQAISIAFSPLITRLYGPEAFGAQGIFTSIAGIFGTIAALTYPMAIMLPNNDADAIGLARLSIYIGIATSALAAVVFYFFGQNILLLLNAQEITVFIYLIPASMLISVVSGVVGQWLIRKKAFTLTAKVTIWQSLLMNSLKTGLGFVHPTVAALIVTNTLSSLLSTLLMLLGLRRTKDVRRSVSKISEKTLSTWDLAKRHRDFPLMRAPQVLLNTLSHSLPVVMLATFFGPATVGFYSIASTVMAVPVNLVAGSVMQVFYPRINEAIRHGENAQDLIVKTTVGLALTGVIPFAVVMATGPNLFAFVFGSEWQAAGVYAQWLSIWLFFQYINKPVVSAIPALHLQRGLLIYELFSTSTKVLALYVGYVLFESDVTAIALFSIFGVLAYSWLILWVIFHSGRLVSNREKEKNEVEYEFP